MSLSRFAFAVSVSCFSALCASAQCVPQWSGEFEGGDPDSTISAMAWFDDGTGMRLYAAGYFRTVGGVVHDGMARWDGTSWQAIPNVDTSASFSRLRVVPDGAGVPRLLATGRFSRLGDDNYVAIWDGTKFGRLPAVQRWPGVSSDAVWFDPDGAGPSPALLIASGSFSDRDSDDVVAAMAWNGTQWSPIFGAPGNDRGVALCVFDPDADGPQLPYLTMYTQSGTTRFYGYTGPVSAGGSGTFFPLPQRVAPHGNAGSLSVFDNDGPGGAPPRLLAIGSNGGATNGVIGIFDGASWTEVEPGASGVTGSAGYAGIWDRDGDGPAPGVVALVGYIQRGSSVSNAVATWDGTTITLEHSAEGFSVGVGAALPPSTPSSAGLPTLVMSRSSAGVRSEGSAHPYMQMYDGGFFDYGAPPPGGPNAYVGRAFVWDPDAGGPQQPAMTMWGSFWTFNGKYVSTLLTRTASGWSTMIPRPGVFSVVTSILPVDPDGPGPAPTELWATGFGGSQPSVRRWTGSAWADLPNSRLNSSTTFRGLVTFDLDGPGPLTAQPIAAGQISSIGQPPLNPSNVARYTGSGWAAVGAGLSGWVNDLIVVDLDGDGPNSPQLFAAGQISASTTPPIRGIARWTGTAWVGIPGNTSNGEIMDLDVYDPDGPGGTPPVLAIAGHMQVGSVRSELWFWNGSTLQAGVGYPQGSNVEAIAVFDVDGPDGPQSPAIYTYHDLRRPLLRRYTGVGPGWVGIEGGDLNDYPVAEPRSMTVFDEDGPGPNPGGLYVFGPFTRAGDKSSPHMARWGCPVGPACSADWDASGYVGGADVSAFLGAWYADLAAGTLLTDFNADGVVNSTDVSDFVNAWFEQLALGCG